MSLINTDREKCQGQGCYACVRNCPANAIMVREGLATVIQERCIACGTCVEVCAPGAKKVESDVEEVLRLLREPSPVIALPSAAFPAAFPEIRPRQLVTALKKLGFSEVMEDAFGAEIVCREYARLLKKDVGKAYISSSCPTVVAYVEKYFPRLIDNLAPIVSPMTAMGRAIKWQYNPGAKLVFIGPCVSKKAEAKDEDVAGVIDAVLTFADLKEMFAASGIDPATEEEGEFSGPKPNLGRLFAIPGGLTHVAGISDEIMSSDVLEAHGRDEMQRILEEGNCGSYFAYFAQVHNCNSPCDVSHQAQIMCNE